MLDSKSPKLNILAAYPYMSKGIIQTLVDYKDDLRFVLDSGAFTAWKSGKPIDFNSYCSYIKDLPVEPWRYFNLDLVGDGKGSYQNYIKMLDKGLKPIPVFTRGEDIELLDEYYKTSDVVAIGGLVGTIGNNAYVNGIMKHINGRKTHLLGFTRPNYITHYKPYMCDSSSWLMGRRFAKIHMYLGGGKFKVLNKEILTDKPNPDVLKQLSLYIKNPSLLAKNKSWVGSMSSSGEVSTKSWIHYSHDLQKYLNVKLFLAASGKKDIELIIKNYNELKGKGVI